MTPATGQFDLTRQFPLSPDQLWHILTDAEERQAWGAPSEDHVLEIDAADVREDGQDLHRCGPKDDPMYTVATRWYRLDAPTGACFTETLSFENARAATSLVTYGLSPSDGGTKLTVHVAVTSFTGEELFGEFQEGWTSALDRLVARLQAETA